MKYTRKKVQDRFNVFIRLRDSMAFDFDYFECISCPSIKSVQPIRNCQAGHYYHFSISGALTMDEVNVNGQCRYCNLNTGTDPTVFLRYRDVLIRKYGNGVIDYLLSKKKNRVYFDQATLKALDDYYKDQIRLISSGKYFRKLKNFP